MNNVSLLQKCCKPHCSYCEDLNGDYLHDYNINAARKFADVFCLNALLKSQLKIHTLFRHVTGVIYP